MGAPISRKSTTGVPLQILVYYSKFLTQIKILIEYDSVKYTFDFINGRISEIYVVSYVCDFLEFIRRCSNMLHSKSNEFILVSQHVPLPGCRLAFFF